MSLIPFEYYFAYGSNMPIARLEQRLGRVNLLGKACISGFELRFHKRGADGSAKCDIWHRGDPKHIVWGVLYAISAEQLLLLDKFEGRGYVRRPLGVQMESGERLLAHSYLATEVVSELMPFDWYKWHVLKGAMEHGFCENYIAAIEAVAAMADPDADRHQREIGVYLP
ncbi:gamma-glutamylcyclotransferase [Aliiglaciecola sp. CAU 1673]|uniref:gamma-glutamylcyclotransferase family protein n=1 Tax=Aliiglaciecola sp. CAU 1673 TaxID=3032595 RepID=UPI0023DA2BA0|nr:gamma-glutamylcyclotransferase family protein [Aliiglaciecola sp. CAU 1673]MDF2179674.1 gamma-glutamylcyclotransferase [Aliiglaciecola sp. CAU 1673]